jgi:hypothetical protein
MRREYVNEAMIAVEHPVVVERGLPVAGLLSGIILTVVFSNLDAAAIWYRLPVDCGEQLVGIRSRQIMASNLGSESTRIEITTMAQAIAK